MTTAGTTAVAALLWMCGCTDYFVDGATVDGDSQSVTETFTQAPLPGLDVLFVVDSTGSMAEEQSGLGSAVGAFIAAVDDLGARYQIGVISMDLDDGGALLGLPWILTSEDPDVVAHLVANLEVGTASPPPSQGLDAVALALADVAGVNVGFRRDSASLHVVFVSDGDDASGDVLGSDPVAAFLGLLAAEASRTGHVARASALVGDIPSGCRGSGGTALPGDRYAEVALASGGQVASICADDFTAIAESIGAVSVEWQVSFPLQADPVEGSVTVAVDGVRQSGGWVVDHAAPALVFAIAPPPDSAVSVSYTLALSAG
jgi:hypothetical protein